MTQVLDLLKVQASETSGNQVRGVCPLHPAGTRRGRTFSANLQKDAYRCFKCGSAGNQLDLWAAATGQSLHAAAIDLCNRLQMAVPEIPRKGIANSPVQTRIEKRNP